MTYEYGDSLLAAVRRRQRKQARRFLARTHWNRAKIALGIIDPKSAKGKQILKETLEAEQTLMEVE